MHFRAQAPATRSPWSVAVAAAIAAAAAGCFTPAGPAMTLVPAPPFAMGQEFVLSGTVIENFREGMQLDSSVHLTLRLPGGEQAKVIYGTGALPCLNHAGTAAGIAREVADLVEVFGVAVSNDTVSVCPSPTYYIRPQLATVFKPHEPQGTAVP